MFQFLTHALDMFFVFVLRLLTFRVLTIAFNHATITRDFDKLAHSKILKRISGCQRQRTKPCDNVSLHLALQKLQALGMRNCIMFQPEISIIDRNV